MKIIVAAEIFPPDIGGPATYSKKIAEELTKLDWQIKLICYSDKLEKDAYSYPVWRVLRTKFFLWHYFKYFWQLKKIAKDTSIIYAQGPVSSGWPATLVGKLLKKKVVVKVVGDYAWEQARNSGVTSIGIDEFQNKKLSGKTKFLKNIETWVCRSADKVVVPSQYLKKIVLGWGVPENKIKVIYNSIPQPESIARQEIEGKDLILSVGRLVSWKGFQTLIEIMPELLMINPNFELVILGDGPEKEKLQTVVANLKLETKVRIIKVDANTRDEYLKSAMVFVLNTGYEGLPHTVLEAMAMGTPVAVSAIGGNPELVEDQKTGLTFRYEDKEQIKQAILKIYQDKALAWTMVKNAKKLLEKFTLENMISQINQLLKSS